jgi:DNA primase
MRAEGVSFRHAVELLQADYGVQGRTHAAGGRKPGAAQPLAAVQGSTNVAGAGSTRATAGLVKRSTVQKLPTALAPDAEDAKLLCQVVDYYHQSLKASPEALAYLEKRGIGSREAIDHFRLGFANRTLGYRLPSKNRREGAAMRGQLQRLGLLRPSGHEHFNGSLVIPVFDSEGKVTELYGRKLNDHLRKGTPAHLYLPGPHQGVWNATALAVSKELILCESLIDALTFWCAGYRNVTASYGVEGFTADHLAAFKQHSIERVLIAYDRDAAGETAAEKLATKLQAEGLDCYRLHFPKGMDANEYALQVRPATQSLGVVIRSAIWLGTGQLKPVTTVASVDTLPDSIPTAEPETPPPADTEVPARPLAAEDKSTAPLPAAAVPESPQTRYPGRGHRARGPPHPG